MVHRPRRCPTLSGYELLETHGRARTTSRSRRSSSTPAASLTRDEEQRLRRYSQLDHHQGRALARAAARRGHAVPAPGRSRRCRPSASACCRPRATATRRFEGRRILIVEDDVRNIFALTSVLEPQGRRGRDRAQRPRGARHARRESADGIDLVLMDIMMPEMDGLDGDARDPQATRAGAKLPIIALTAKAMTRRPGAVPGRRRQRLHRQAARRREAALAGARLDAEVSGRATRPRRDFDIELQLLLEAIYLQVPLRLPRLRAGVAEAPRAARRWTRFGCAHASRSCRSACCTTPALFPQLLQYLTVQVSEMFRDPAYFRALREQVVPLLRTYPSLKVWVAGCSTGEEVYSLAILLREEGLLERTLIYATDINPQALRQGRGRASTPLDRIAGFTENHQRVGRRAARSPTTTRRPTARAVFDQRAAQAHRLLRPQPGDRQRVRRGAAGLLPQRADLLQPRAAGPRARPVPRRAVPQGLPRPRRQGVAALLGARRRASTSSSRDERIYQKRTRAMSARSTLARRASMRSSIGASAGGVEALLGAAAGAAGRAARRRSSSCCTCRASARACWPSIFAPQLRAAGARGARTRSRCAPGTRLLRAAGLPPAGRARTAARARRPTSRCTSRGRRSTCCSSRPPTSTASACSASC